MDGLESAALAARVMAGVGRREGCGQPRRRLICFLVELVILLWLDW